MPHTPSGLHTRSKRLGFWAAIFTAFGLVVSAPTAALTYMQPKGLSQLSLTEQFSTNYNAGTTFSLSATFIALLGYIIFMSCLTYYVPRDKRLFPLIGMGFALIYTVLTSLNHMLQLVIVRQSFVPEDIQLFKLLAVFNPYSLFWTFEVLGIGFQSLSAFILVPVFSGLQLREWVRTTLIVNGSLGLFGAIMTAIDARWMQGQAGAIGFLLWAFTFIIAMVLIAYVMRPRGSGLDMSD